ncbi:MAG: Panacea domain-containing protein [bacterium]
MIPYKKEKIDNAICFFAKEHKRKTGKYLYQTFLYKYLAFLEFNMLKKTGHPVFDLDFHAFEHGPVPVEIYNKRKRLENDLYKFDETKIREFDDKIGYIVISKREPDLDYFSDNEIKEMNDLITIFATTYTTAKTISDVSHKNIEAWKKTWKINPYGLMNQDYTFSEDLFSKPENSLNFAEECYLTYKAIQSA